MKISRDRRYKTNQALEGVGANLRIDVYNPSGLTLLSNGMELDRSEFLRFERRVKSPYFSKVIDSLYSLDRDMSKAALKEVKRECSMFGAKANLERNREAFISRGVIGLQIARERGNCGYKKGNVPFNKGKNKDNSELYAKMSADRTGAGNPMYGRVRGPEYRALKSRIAKELIRSGKFTPNVMNSRTSKSLLWNGRKYRSSWEVIFARCNPSYSYETLRVPYSFEGRDRNYLVDFVDHEQKIAVEIKPDSQAASNICIAKMDALQEWTATNGYTIQHLGDDEIGSLYASLPEDDSVFACFTVHMIRGLKKAYEISKQRGC